MHPALGLLLLGLLGAAGQAAALTLDQAAQQLGLTDFIGQFAGLVQPADSFQGVLLCPPANISWTNNLPYHVLTTSPLTEGVQTTLMPGNRVTVTQDSANWYLFGFATQNGADGPIYAKKTDCVTFNTAATLCKISAPLAFVAQTLYMSIKTRAELSQLQAVIDAQPDLQAIYQNVDTVCTLFAPTNDAINLYLKGRSFDQWKNSTEAYNVTSGLCVLSAAKGVPYIESNTQVNGKPAKAVYFSQDNSVNFVDLVPTNYRDVVAAVLQKLIPGGKSNIWTVDRVLVPTTITGTLYAGAATATVARWAVASLAGAAAVLAMLI